MKFSVEYACYASCALCLQRKSYFFLSPNAAAYQFRPFPSNLLSYSHVFNSLAHTSINFLPHTLPSISCKLFFGCLPTLCCLIFSLFTEIFSLISLPSVGWIYLSLYIPPSGVFYISACPISSFCFYCLPTLRSCLSCHILIQFLKLPAE